MKQSFQKEKLLLFLAIISTKALPDAFNVRYQNTQHYLFGCFVNFSKANVSITEKMSYGYSFNVTNTKTLLKTGILPIANNLRENRMK